MLCCDLIIVVMLLKHSVISVMFDRDCVHVMCQAQRVCYFTFSSCDISSICHTVLESIVFFTSWQAQLLSYCVESIISVMLGEAQHLCCDLLRCCD